MTTQRVIITDGEYSDYNIIRLLNVPSMDWLREKIKLYTALKQTAKATESTLYDQIELPAFTGNPLSLEDHERITTQSKKIVLGLIGAEFADIIHIVPGFSWVYVDLIDFDKWLFLRYPQELSEAPYEEFYLNAEMKATKNG